MTEQPPNTAETSVQPDDDFPAVGRLLGIDYGTKRVGLAMSSADQTFAGSLDNYNRRSPPLDLQYIQEVVREQQIVGLIVGLPVHQSGDEGGKAGEARQFGDWLSAGIGVPVRYWDERYTSAMAEQILQFAGLSKKKRQARKDKLAAQLILQAYLEAPDRTATPRSM